MLHRVCAFWRFKVVRTRRNMLGPVAGSRSGVHRMSLGLAVLRIRCVTTRRSRC